MALRADQSQRLVALAGVGWLMLSYPLLALFNRPVQVGGIPLVVLYLFSSWALLIGLMVLATRRGPSERPQPPPGGSP